MLYFQENRTPYSNCIVCLMHIYRNTIACIYMRCVHCESNGSSPYLFSYQVQTKHKSIPIKNTLADFESVLQGSVNSHHHVLENLYMLFYGHVTIQFTVQGHLNQHSTIMQTLPIVLASQWQCSLCTEFLYNKQGGLPKCWSPLYIKKHQLDTLLTSLQNQTINDSTITSIFGILGM